MPREIAFLNLEATHLSSCQSSKDIGSDPFGGIKGFTYLCVNISYVSVCNYETMKTMKPESSNEDNVPFLQIIKTANH